MRSTLLAVAIAAGLGVTSFAVMAQDADTATTTHKVTHKKVATNTVAVNADDLAAMKAQLSALQQKVAELETKADAQADAQIQTAQVVNSVQADSQTQAATLQKVTATSIKSSDKIAYKGVNITLGGFAAAESIYRTHNEGADMASSWNAIPYKNVPVGHTQEFKESSRQSRVSALIQGDYNETTHLAAYYEVDFLGAAQTANQNESNSFTPRTRNLYLTADWDTSGLHLLAGQNWSLLTLNTKGITPRSEAPPPTIDAQYLPGFTWARQTQIRLVKDWNQTVWLGVSLENPQTTFYNSPNAAKAPVQPINNIAAGSGYDSANTLSLNHMPDVIVKLAADPGFGHYEVFGIGRAFYNRYLGTNHNVYGGGWGVGLIMPVVDKMLDFQFSGMNGKGIGRYGSAQLADVTTNPNGSLSPIKETMALAGLTLHATPDLDIYGFAGEERQEKASVTLNGVAYGYGNPLYNNSGCDTEGAASALCVGNTKKIDQETLGFWWKFYQGKFGKMQFGAQYSHTERTAFEGIGGAPSAKDDMIFTSFRYYPF
jgi:TolA-binding protein